MSKAFLEDSMSLDALLRASHSDRVGDEARAIHQQLRQLVRLRERYDLMVGRLAIAIQLTEGWRRLGFATFAEYCEERLGMDVTVSSDSSPEYASSRGDYETQMCAASIRARPPKSAPGTTP